MLGKRKYASACDDTAPSKRLRPSASPASKPPTHNIISKLSDELLVRIFSYFTETTLLSIAPVSRRFRRITGDSQLWRAHYYTRFVLPRALRIPGFKGTAQSGSKLHYSARRAAWADGGWGRRGGLLDVKETEGETWKRVDWKRQYKLRHNWARGKCAVEEVSVRDAESEDPGQRTLIKVVEGIALTADPASGLRAWDLRTRRPIAQIHPGIGFDEEAQPTCLDVDEQSVKDDALDIIVGFTDGAFGIWRLDLRQQELRKRYYHEKSSNGGLEAVTFGYPYILTATGAGLISLYTFESTTPKEKQNQEGGNDTQNDGHTDSHEESRKSTKDLSSDLSAPYLLTSLKSHTTKPPLALSIRKMTASVSASIAYTFDSREGWCIGIQDIKIESSASAPNVLSSRLAYTLPIQTGGALTPQSPSSRSQSPDDSRAIVSGSGPTKLCYSHPYLLATLPDNTLILHLCTSTSTSLSFSPGIRLWGHTSGISDAEITPRGKAVSVSMRGNEIRVWELEGRVGGSSIEVRPRQAADDADLVGGNDKPSGMDRPEWEDRRNWVGFDDEMVIVLKEARDGRESLVVYDFT